MSQNRSNSDTRGGSGTETDLGFEEGTWVSITNMIGYTYYRHHPSGDTTWIRPDATVSQNWQAYQNEFGQTHFHCSSSNTTMEKIPCIRNKMDRVAGAREKSQDDQRWWKRSLSSTTNWATGAVSGVRSVLSRIGNFTLEKATDVKDIVADMYTAEREVDAQFNAALKAELAEITEQDRQLALRERAALDELKSRKQISAQREGPPLVNDYNSRISKPKVKFSASSSPHHEVGNYNVYRSNFGRETDQGIVPAPPIPVDRGPPCDFSPHKLTGNQMPSRAHDIRSARMSPMVLGWKPWHQNIADSRLHTSMAHTDKKIQAFPHVTAIRDGMLFTGTDTDTV